MNKKSNKMLVLLLAVGMIVSLTACGTGQENLPEQPSAQNAQVNTAEGDSDNETEVNEVDLDFSVFNIINEKAEGQVMVDLSLCSVFLKTPSTNGKTPPV